MTLEEEKKAKNKEYHRIYGATYYLRNKERARKRGKIWRAANRDKIRASRNTPEAKARRCEFHKENAARRNAQVRAWQAKNKNYCRQKQKEYNLLHIDELREKRRLRAQIPENRISQSLRRRLRDFVKSGARTGKIENLFGCTAQDLRLHLERQFSRGMNWINYGVFGWHIDHKIPASAFDMGCPRQRKLAFHWTNLQPLWREDNLSKYTKIYDGQLPLLGV